ncbi:hypothetical protein VT50_0201800 [Streptomyces antioxidans]|uniref:DUF2127 domain-containing protein n=1 Tax=Streptomyces antioxidans TaxID=1507734 RepID=A0A1V4DDG7_9ACTN|nr:hypothetical protein [Streptomyces antioxidans]OPF84760.1 hypothetical protein VT50_0201800 [Streptomyces antioxidans]
MHARKPAKALGPTPTSATRTLQVVTAVCSLLFALGSALHGFAVIDTSVIEEMMRRAGGADPAGDAPGFTTGFRIVGTVYVVGNALGVLALWSRSQVLYWWVLAVNVTQGLGWVMIPSEMWTVVSDRYGAWGVLPSAVTDGGAVVLSVVLLVALVRFRTPWAQRRAVRP